jgi:hypothetical protein
MSLKLVAEMNRLKEEVATLKAEVGQANQRPHMLAELVTRFEGLEAAVKALEAGLKKPSRRNLDA